MSFEDRSDEGRRDAFESAQADHDNNTGERAGLDPLTPMERFKRDASHKQVAAGASSMLDYATTGAPADELMEACPREALIAVIEAVQELAASRSSVVPSVGYEFVIAEMFHEIGWDDGSNRDE